ncbi:uncharacterized protein EDB91DRAFT_1239965 [Suillus paluster]|uniref:uncharacterized protein n=1 Tax=Suillus paluster TaxID=48578 RepID=UPI001B8845C3|nr:uncharacterized protein EDB91DRAFT_1239965 [Suillus paluster]KAG1724562.1 hypothetical protein EDB91DRAFT_1239965 [Suillus paluster]
MLFLIPHPVIETLNGRRTHGFNPGSAWFLDKKDARSTGNMRKHVKICWGDEVLQTAYEAKNMEEIRTKIVAGILHDGSITESFEHEGKGKHTQAELVHWVAESLRPFNIVKDRGFQCLMKTGRPEYYIPSP